MTDRTLYVVGGYMRSGTSMMMRALEAGGLVARYSQSRDEMKQRHADAHYDPNVGGLYELARVDYRRPDFPRGYDGCLIKGLNHCVPQMAVMPHGIRVVFMRRDAEEIRQSLNAFFDGDIPDMDGLDARMEDVLARIHNRRDVLSCTVLWYRSVVEEPLAAFQTLALDGWPIDVASAASIVDPSLCRFKIEELEVGVV